MRIGAISLVVLSLLLWGLVGCRSAPTEQRPAPTILPAVFEQETQQPETDAEPLNTLEILPTPEDDSDPPASTGNLQPESQTPLTLNEVVASVRSHFPKIQQAAAARGVAAGQALSASGAFDHKLDGFSESQPLDFYENYRHSIGVKRETMWGGQTFAGYRVGRGFFEPWYLERETNKGGEFKAGFIAPLVRDRVIDANRSELWQAQIERQRVEPEIMAEVIRYVREGSITYWNWVAAGEYYRISEGLLELAKERNEGLQEQVNAQEKAEIDLVDNRRIIVSREAKLIDARRKLEQSAVKLSLYYRSDIGEPRLVDPGKLPEQFQQLAFGAFPTIEPGPEADDTSQALAQRPELAELQLVREQLCVALRQAKNETWPDVDGGLLVAQDVGEPTSSKRDKSEFEVEALLTVSVPLERRKAVGKVRSLRSKLAQLNAKNRFATDKIVAEVRLARSALAAARERVERATENYGLAQQMQEAEQERFNQGQSTLFNLNIREKQTAEAAADRIQALFEYSVAQADYRAALGYDGLIP